MCELGGSGAVTAVNTFGAAGLLSRRVISGSVSTFYTFDERGNVAQRTNSSAGVLSSDLYDSFGNKLAGGAAGDPWGFEGQDGYYTDSETGLLLLTHRYYDPQAGRFLTRDPIGYDGGINLYGYVSNDPVNESDPSGLAQDVGGSNDTIRLSLAAFIPVPTVGGFKGDGRRFSANNGHYRTEQNVIINLKLGTVHILPGRVGTTHSAIGWYAGTASNDGMTGSFTRGSCGDYQITLKEVEGNPYFHGLAPTIRYNMKITVDSQGHVTNWQGTHSGYPAFELYSYQNGMLPNLDFGYMPKGSPFDLAIDVPFAHNP